MERAADAAGAPVEMISGREEARLIHLGVESRWPQGGRRALLIDIGGGSAEIIAAEDGRLREAFSRPLGAVRLHEIFLKNDPPAERELHQLHEYMREKLVPAVRGLGPVDGTARSPLRPPPRPWPARWRAWRGPGARRSTGCACPAAEVRELYASLSRRTWRPGVR